MIPSVLIVEGAEYASALATYLKTCCHYEVVEYQPEKERFVRLLDRIIEVAWSPRIVVLRAHLTALSRGLISPLYFKEFESAVASAQAKLVLAVSETDTGNTGILAEPYSHSWLVKRAYHDGDKISDLLDWLGLKDESRRIEASAGNVAPNGAERIAGLSVRARPNTDNRKVGKQPRDNGPSPDCKRAGNRTKAGGR